VPVAYSSHHAGGPVDKPFWSALWPLIHCMTTHKFGGSDYVRQCPATVSNKQQPDGITYEALKAFWGTLTKPMIACCNEAFTDDSPEPMLPLSQRSGVITLIHKAGGKPLDEVTSGKGKVQASSPLLATLHYVRLAGA
jgi:hypothetical protein